MSNIRKIETHNVTDDSQGHNDVLHPLVCLDTYSLANFCVFLFLQNGMKHNPPLSPPPHSLPSLQHSKLPVWQSECWNVIRSSLVLGPPAIVLRACLEKNSLPNFFLIW